MFKLKPVLIFQSQFEKYFHYIKIFSGAAQVESLLSVGDEEGRIGLSFLQSQALSPAIYPVLKCKGDGNIWKIFLRYFEQNILKPPS